MRTTHSCIPLLILALFLPACSGQAPSRAPVPTVRPARWATPMREYPGLSNFYNLDNRLYRGAQPGPEGFQELKKLGMKTVINLRTMHSDTAECLAAGLDYISITVQAWEGEDEEVAEFLRAATDPARQPVFVHCQHGADRTGVMCAVYRMAVQGWSREDAVQEMLEGGYGFHSVWQNLVDYVNTLDIDRIKILAGLDAREPRSAGLKKIAPRTLQ